MKPLIEVTKSSRMMMFVFIGWILTSFACHFCAKLFIKESSAIILRNEYSVIVLSILQVSFYMQVISLSDENDKEAMFHKLVIVINHIFGTLATNWSFALTHAASTIAIKLMEPLTSAILQRTFLKVRLSYLQWMCIPTVVFGAIVFAKEEDAWVFNLSKGTVLAFISNVCLSIRNVYMKKNHFTNSTPTKPNTRLNAGICVFGVIGVLILYHLENIGVTPSGSLRIYLLLLGSSLFHAIYSYISTVVVLYHFSVVGHAFGNIFKRLAVLGLLYLTGSRTASLVNFIGLFICTTGLVIYAFSKVQDYNQKSKESDTLFPSMMTSKILLASLVGMTIVLISFYHLVGIHGMPLSVKKYRSKYEIFNHKTLTNLSVSKQVTFNITDFYSVDLTKNIEEANKLSSLLTKRSDVIDEAQRIHMNIFKTLLSGYRFAILFDYAVSENKGDSAITVGELLFLKKLDIEVLFTCKIECSQKDLSKAHDVSRKYTNTDLVILFHGGGNVIGWPSADTSRSRQIKMFMQYHIIMFPQSILYIEPQSHIQFCQKLYASHPRLTFVWRDKVSFDLGKKLFPKVRSLLSPDIAYQIGFVPRFMYPTVDILWIKRTDKESPVYNIPAAPKGIRMHVSDWLKWTSPRGESSMENAFLMTTTGMMFLQRGRVVITDRLHGHILSTLLNIPHVYIDNTQRKISNYHNTWTASLENIVLANSSNDAVLKATELLKKLDKDLPEIKGIFN